MQKSQISTLIELILAQKEKLFFVCFYILSIGIIKIDNVKLFLIGANNAALPIFFFFLS